MERPTSALEQHNQLMSNLETRRKRRGDELSAAGHHGIVRQQQLASSLPRRPASSTQQRYSSPRLASSGGAGAAARGKGAIDDAAETEKRQIKKLAFGDDYSVEEDSIRSDYSQNYLNSGRRPQNLLQGCEIDDRFAEYPKLAKLLSLHSDLVKQHACAPTYLPANLRDFPLTSLLPTKFDCILIDPPLEEYYKNYPTRFQSSEQADGRPVYWSWDDIAALPIPAIASNPGFIWLWVGSGKADGNGVSGLDKGREILAKWGYRRCEDITWLRTNKLQPSLADESPTSTLMTHTKEHCLMGIRGTVRRSTDGHFVHCNIDTDVIVWEGIEDDPLHKPPELYNLIENFCLGTRRLELFGSSKNLRPGWLTIGTDASPTSASSMVEAEREILALPQPYEKSTFDTYFQAEAMQSGGNLVPTTAEVETLRPRSPGGPNKNSSASNMPGVKSNPQGIGRHTNRSGTPSASQQLEYQQVQKNMREQAMRQQQQMEMERQAMEQQRMMQMQQQQQWAMQQAQFMGMMHQPNMGMGMMPMQMGMPGPQMGMGMMSPNAMMGGPGPGFQGMTPQQMQMMQMQQQQYPQQQQYNGQNMMNNGQYGYNQYQQFF